MSFITDPRHLMMFWNFHKRIIFFTVLFVLVSLTSCKKLPPSESPTAELKDNNSVCIFPKPGEVPTGEMIRKTAGVTEDEVRAINNYTSDTMKSSIIKGLLQCVKKEELDDWCIFGADFIKTAAEFESGIQKISETMPYVGVVYRGILVSRKAAESVRLQVGKTLGLAENGKTAYISSSRNLDFAKRWVDDLAEMKKRELGADPTTKVIYTIHQCRGASIEGIEPAARAAMQREVVLPPSQYNFASSRVADGMLFLTLFEAGCGAGLALSDSIIDDNNDLSDRGSAQSDLNEVVDNTNVISEDIFSVLSEYVVLEESLKSEDDDTPWGFKLANNCIPIDQAKRAEAKATATELVDAADEVKQTQEKLNAAPADHKNSVIDTYDISSKKGLNAVKKASKLLKNMKFIGGKIIPVAGALAEVAGTALGIVEAVNIKKDGGSDAKAAAAVLEGFGLAGAISSVVAVCEDGCDDGERACAFFKGLLGIDFCAQAKCSEGFEPVGCCICRERGCQPYYDDLAATCHRGAKIVSADNSSCPWHDKCGLTTARGCSRCEDSSFTNDGCTCRRDPHSYSKRIHWYSE